MPNDSTDLREQLDNLFLDVERGAIAYKAGTEYAMQLIETDKAAAVQAARIDELQHVTANGIGDFEPEIIVSVQTKGNYWFDMPIKERLAQLQAKGGSDE